MVRSEVFLPVLIDAINSCGIPDSNIFIVFALGLHRRQTPDEQCRIVGEKVARRVAVYDHDSRDVKNLVALGRTSRGNQVWINRRVYEADRVVLTGEIIHHQIAGYTGGRKSLIPGVAGAVCWSILLNAGKVPVVPRRKNGWRDFPAPSRWKRSFARDSPSARTRPFGWRVGGNV